MNGKIFFLLLTLLCMPQVISSSFAEEIYCAKENGKTKCWNVKSHQDVVEESIKFQQNANQTADDIMRRHPELNATPHLINKMLELRAHYMERGNTMSQALILAEKEMLRNGELIDHAAVEATRRAEGKLGLREVVTTQAGASNYDIIVTRKGRNLYKVDGKDIFLITRYCYEYVYSEKSILLMNGYSGEIIFTGAGGKCDIKAVYGQVQQQEGKYPITLNREDDDWYEIIGQGVYIKTNSCLNLAIYQDGVLSVSPGGYGTLYIGDDQCMVEGVYSKMRL